MSTVARHDRAAWRRLLHRASTPYRGAGRFAWHFARGKLGLDPVFRHLPAAGLIPPGARVLDIGCGQGLLASLLRACGELRARGEWPAAWPEAPRGIRLTGIELMERDVARARAALGEGGDTHFVCGDMRNIPFPESEVVVLLDVLHYVTHAEQETLLRRVRDALVPGGRLLLRVGDAGNGRGFAISQWVDRCIAQLRGHRRVTTHGRTLAEWMAQLAALGLQAEARPMSRGTPFANVLLVAQRA